MTAKKPAIGPIACVIGTMDLVRPLGWAGIPCALVGQTSDPGRGSRFVTKFIERADPIKTPEILLGRLQAFAARQREKPLLYYEGDGGLIFTSRHREALSEHFHFVVAESDLVEDVTDKIRFSRLADRLDLPVPRSQWLAPHKDEPKDLRLRYPLVVKPVARQVRGVSEFGTAKAIVIPSPEKIQEIWDHLSPTARTFIFQELVPGPESCVESYHAYVDLQGSLIVDFGGRKIRTSPPEYGHSTALLTSDAPDLIASGREITERLGLRGVLKIDFKRGPDGKLWLLEINPRFNLWHGLGAKAGANIPAIVYADLTGRPRPAFGPVRAGARWCRTLHDFKAARCSGELSLSWFWDTLTSDCNTLDLTDPGLVLATLRQVIHLPKL